MANWLNSLLCLVFPPRCEVCRKESKESLCPECFEQIKFMRPHLGIYNVSVYEGVVRDAIRRFKFKKRKNLAEPLGILLVKYLSNSPAIEMGEIDVIVPVPLHARRLRQRGFNQSKMLADVVGRYFEVPVVQALERVKYTRAQFDLPRQERFRNVARAFRVSNNKSVFNKRALLLDDIYTTGATVAECSKALKIAGAKRVEILTLSRAIDPALS